MFSGFVETGYHATPGEIAKEKVLKQTSGGASLQYHGNRLKLGMNGYFTLFDKTLLGSDDLYKRYSFAGNELAGTSVDYRYLADRTQLFGEASYSNASVATINGFLFFIRPEITIGALHRYYQKGYYSYYANAFSENSTVANENGFFLGGELQFRNYRIRMYGDVFSFPWLKYRVNMPSEGYEYFAEIGRKMDNSDFYFRYKRQIKPENYYESEEFKDVRDLLKEQFRFNGIYSVTEKLTLQNRIEISRAAFKDKRNNFGFLVFQDIVYRQMTFPLDVSFRIAYFNTSDYNARIYAYERDVLYSYGSRMHYGKGWRFVCMLKWKPLKYLTFWFRISQSLYPGEKEIGNGLNQIQSNHKTEVKIQSIVRF
ncbi:hypothetical protein ES705_42333 [subsurface metagenome]